MDSTLSVGFRQVSEDFAKKGYLAGTLTIKGREYEVYFMQFDSVTNEQIDCKNHTMEESAKKAALLALRVLVETTMEDADLIPKKLTQNETDGDFFEFKDENSKPIVHYVPISKKESDEIKKSFLPHKSSLRQDSVTLLTTPHQDLTVSDALDLFKTIISKKLMIDSESHQTTPSRQMSHESDRESGAISSRDAGREPGRRRRRRRGAHLSRLGRSGSPAPTAFGNSHMPVGMSHAAIAEPRDSRLQAQGPAGPASYSPPEDASLTTKPTSLHPEPIRGGEHATVTAHHPLPTATPANSRPTEKPVQPGRSTAPDDAPAQAEVVAGDLSRQQGSRRSATSRRSSEAASQILQGSRSSVQAQLPRLEPSSSHPRRPLSSPTPGASTPLDPQRPTPNPTTISQDQRHPRVDSDRPHSRDQESASQRRAPHTPSHAPGSDRSRARAATPPRAPSDAPSTRQGEEASAKGGPSKQKKLNPKGRGKRSTEEVRRRAPSPPQTTADLMGLLKF